MNKKIGIILRMSKDKKFVIFPKMFYDVKYNKLRWKYSKKWLLNSRREFCSGDNILFNIASNKFSFAPIKWNECN